MKYVQIIAACDMTRAGTGEIVQAAETVYVALGSDPGNLQVRELDLSEDWSKELHGFLQPYLDASHEPGELVTPAGDSGENSLRATRQFNQVRVNWARAHGYNLTPRSKGGYYVPKKTRQAYELHLAGRDDELTGANGMQPDYDPATGNSI